MSKTFAITLTVLEIFLLIIFLEYIYYATEECKYYNSNSNIIVKYNNHIRLFAPIYISGLKKIKVKIKSINANFLSTKHWYLATTYITPAMKRNLQHWQQTALLINTYAYQKWQKEGTFWCGYYLSLIHI